MVVTPLPVRVLVNRPSDPAGGGVDLEGPGRSPPSPYFAGELGTDDVEKASVKSGAGIDKLGRLSSFLDFTF